MGRSRSPTRLARTGKKKKKKSRGLDLGESII